MAVHFSVCFNFIIFLPLLISTALPATHSSCLIKYADHFSMFAKYLGVAIFYWSGQFKSLTNENCFNYWRQSWHWFGICAAICRRWLDCVGMLSTPVQSQQGAALVAAKLHCSASGVRDSDSDSEHHQYLSPLTQTYLRSSTTSIGVIYCFTVDKFKHRRQPSPNRRSRSFLALFQ